MDAIRSVLTYTYLSRHETYENVWPANWRLKKNVIAETIIIKKYLYCVTALGNYLNRSTKAHKGTAVIHSCNKRQIDATESLEKGQDV